MFLAVIPNKDKIGPTPLLPHSLHSLARFGSTKTDPTALGRGVNKGARTLLAF
jgi:hypothetical protein